MKNDHKYSLDSLVCCGFPNLVLDTMKNEKTEEEIRKDALETQAIMEEVMHDPEVRQAMADAQRECGTLTPEELRRPFTI